MVQACVSPAKRDSIATRLRNGQQRLAAGVVAIENFKN
jgi:hypothetical protein